MEVQSCGSSFVCHVCVVTVVRFWDCTKDKICCYCPLSSPYSLSVACASFYLYFSFIHSAIFFFLSQSQSQSLSPFLFYVGFYVPMPPKDPVWLALSSFSAHVTLFVVWFSVLLKCTFGRDHSLTSMFTVAHCHTHGEHSLFQQIWLPAWLNLCENVCRGVFWGGNSDAVLTHLVPQTWHNHFCHMMFMISKQEDAGPNSDLIWDIIL